MTRIQWSKETIEKYLKENSKGKIECVKYIHGGKCEFICNDCNTIFKGTASTIMSTLRKRKFKHNCEHAKKFEKMTLEKFKEKLAALPDNQNGEYEFPYLDNEWIDYDTKVTCKHTACNHIWKVRPSHFTGTMNTRCPNCKSGISRYEQEILDWLQTNKIPFIHQYTNDELGKKSFDFAILKENSDIRCFIEFDGEQHIKKKFNMSDEEFEKQQASDQFKNKYAFDHNIFLLRIQYKDRNKIDSILKNLLGSTTIETVNKGVEYTRKSGNGKY